MATHRDEPSKDNGGAVKMKTKQAGLRVKAAVKAGTEIIASNHNLAMLS